ncbi:MAG TPA: NAD-dependent epimerase/dehydratase family protein [Acidimicrobiales bacterium]|nr:NAD-dependent epimerase/dehydratase family protein [Acidimicrobiales bacterium]
MAQHGGLRVAVTGVTGNVGTSLVSTLASDDRVGSIIGIARRAPQQPLPRTEFRSADVARDDLVPLLTGADVVVHLAWLFQPTHRPTVTWEANVVGSERVFDAAARAGARAVVYASSVGAYSRGEGDARVDEGWPTHSLPTAGYGREKAYVERLLDAFECRHAGIRVVRLRPAFIFKRASATQQRRLFAGPLVLGSLVASGKLPVVPFPAGLRFQALHTDDAAEAYRLAVTNEVRGAFNLAAEPVIDAEVAARVLRGRPVAVPPSGVRALISGAWHARAVPADPALFDLALGLPLMSSARARSELGWAPRVAADDAVAEMLRGLGRGEGGPTPPLAPDTVSGRAEEVRTAVTSTDT